jgi:HEPN domain-containing protein
MKRPREHALTLLEKAEHDLIAATATIATGRALDTVCFHAQQAVEKSLKALLALKDVDYPWRHDLGELLILVDQHFSTIELPRDEILALSPYAVEIRYDSIAPTLEDATSAIATAKGIHGLAQHAIETSPPRRDPPTDP